MMVCGVRVGGDASLIRSRWRQETPP